MKRESLESGVLARRLVIGCDERRILSVAASQDGRSFDVLGRADFPFNREQATVQPIGLPDLVQNGDGTIRLDKSVRSAPSTGTLAASAYKEIGHPGATVEANDRIVDDDDTGALYCDADRSGAGEHVHGATLDTAPATLTGAEFFVVA